MLICLCRSSAEPTAYSGHCRCRGFAVPSAVRYPASAWQKSCMRTSKFVLKHYKLFTVASRSVYTRSAVPSLIRSMHQDTPRVLSIQSHVVHGHVGNKCAVFPLQLLGFDVDPINSVQFSNHTGYSSFKGKLMDGQELWEIIEGLQANDLLQYTHLLTGYIASVSFLETVATIVKALRQKNPDLIYICDPVMGDDDRLYVSKDLVPAYREQIVSLATVLTPNQYEAELLTGIKINSKASAFSACQALHRMGVATVVITSIRLAELKDELLLMASTQTKQRSGCPMQIQVNIPMLDAYFTGTGDLLTALLLARLHKDPDNMQHAIELAVASLQGVLLASAEASGEAAHATERTAQVCRKRELRLIQNQHLLQSPPVKLKAKPLPAEL